MTIREINVALRKIRGVNHLKCYEELQPRSQEVILHEIDPAIIILEELQGFIENIDILNLARIIMNDE